MSLTKGPTSQPQPTPNASDVQLQLALAQRQKASLEDSLQAWKRSRLATAAKKDELQAVIRQWESSRPDMLRGFSIPGFSVQEPIPSHATAHCNKNESVT